MSALTRKALRDLWHLRGQAIAIALVVAAGIANLVMSRATLESLSETRERFYRDHAFADVFAQARRVPESVAERLRAIDGVQAVETRLMAGATLALPGFDQPVRAQVLSVRDEADTGLNRLYLRRGRLPVGEDEIAISEAFAEAHRLLPGDRLTTTLHGRRRSVNVVGVALSPEFVYQIQPGAIFPDFKRFAVIWMSRRSLEAALDMDGAFNAVALSLAARTADAPVIATLDTLLAPYGGTGAYGRDVQVSNHFLNEELRQLNTMAQVFPTIFLAVAAFLLHVVMSRLIGMQRDQIAILKAFGYGNGAIAAHFALLVSLIVAFGIVLGLCGGIALGQWLAGIYQTFYRFPFLSFRLSPSVFALGVVVSVLAATLGTARAVLSAARLPPAEAMRPPAPERFRPSRVERLGLARQLSQPMRMVLRQIERRPWKSALAVIGLAMACAIMMVGRFQSDAIDLLIDVQLRIGERDQLSVDFVEPRGPAALAELRQLPGVIAVEPYRQVAVRLRAGHRDRRNAIQGLLVGGELKAPVDASMRRIPLPPNGVVLTDHLATQLRVGVGSIIEIDVLDGQRPTVAVPVSGIAREYLGLNVYMALPALNRLLGENDRYSGAALAVAADGEAGVLAALDRRPGIAGVGVRRLAIRNFYDTIGDSMGAFNTAALLLGALINFGVVYNAARVSLSERGRELASLRVLGFTRGETTQLIVGELALLVVIAIPLGFVAGDMLCQYMAYRMQSDLFRVPVQVSANTYGMAGLTMLASTLLSAWFVRRRIDRLDLIAVLKTRE